MRAWAVLRPASIESRFEALHAGGLTELVGEKKNSNFCLGGGQRQRPRKAKWCCSPGKPVSVNAFTAAVMERLEGQPHTRLRYFCSPH